MKMLKAFYQKQGVTACARIAMVIHCLEQALQPIDSMHTTPWNNNISLEAVQAATTVIMHFIQQKFIMLGIDVESSTTDVLSSRMVYNKGLLQDISLTL